MIDQREILEKCRQLDSEGKTEESIRLLTDAILRSPAAGLFYERGWRFEEIGQNNSALEDYTNAIEREPISKYLAARGLLLSSGLRDHESALRDFQRALAISPEAPDLYINMALCNLLLGRVRLAIEDASRAVELAPQCGLAHSVLGQGLLAANLPTEAAQELRVATSLPPASANSWSLLGRALRDASDLSGAKACYERSLELDRSASCLISYAGLLLELNEPLLAIAALHETRGREMTESERYLAKGYLELASRSQKSG
jgi:tetratricopeptide (TPR) repeat protein